VGTDRKAKKRKEEARKRRQRERQATEYDRIISLIGAKDLFDRLDEEMREYARSLRYPDPEICCGDDLAGAPERENVKEAVEQAIDALTLALPDAGQISARLYLRVVASQMMLVAELRRSNRDSSLSELIAQTSKTVSQVWNAFIGSYVRRHLIAVDMALAEFTRIDTAIYWCIPTYERAKSGENRFTLTLHKSPPQIRVFVRDGEPRRAFRCGSSFGANGIWWINVQASLFGLNDSREYPLYVQSHAIRQLLERVPIEEEGVVHDLMWRSFMDPNVKRNAKGTYLIEFYYYKYKLGYFFVEVADEAILITTFTFLTMQGTPEADALYKQLRLMGRDIKQLGLDTLATYLFTDLQKDEELIRIFEKCGCGHLLRMANPETASEWESGYARSVRLYLGMKLPEGSMTGQ
jgi:hypothetical protein